MSKHQLWIRLSYPGRLTIELVDQPSTSPQNGTLSREARQHFPQHQVYRVINQCPYHSLSIQQVAEPLPAYIALQLVQSEGRWLEERWWRTSGDIIDEEGEEVADDWQAEGYTQCANAGLLLVLRATRRDTTE